MYGEVLLITNDARRSVELTLQWRDWLAPDFLPLSDDEAMQRRQALPGLLAGLEGAPAAWRQTPPVLLARLAVMIDSPGHLRQAIELAASHLRLPATQRQARADFIARLFAAEFDDVLQEGDAWQPLGQLLEDMCTRAVLMPQALLEPTIREACLTLRTQLLETRRWYEDAVPVSYSEPLRWMGQLMRSGDSVLAPALSTAIWTRHAADRNGFVERLERLRQQAGLAIVWEAWLYVLDRGCLNRPVMVGDFVAAVVDEAASGDAMPNTQALLDACWHLVAHTFDSMVQRGILDTLEAAQTNGALPDQGLLKEIQPLLMDWVVMERAPLPMRQEQAAKSSPTLKASSVPDGEAAHTARCQLKTVQWLQGPIAADHPPELNVIALVDQELAIDIPPPQPRNKKAKAIQQDQAKRKLERSAAVQNTMQVALLDNAAFLAGQIDDGLAEAKGIGVTGNVLTDATVCAKNLTALRSGSVPAVKYPAARQLLLAAEEVVARLHAALRDACKVQAKERVVQRLLRQLCLALDNETLILGKRNGGVIAFEASPGDWGWIARRLHRRHLASATKLVVGDRLVSLGRDRALGLYVTQSSRSSDQYAFDISVHLWRRREAATGAPSGLLLDSDPFPHMNEQSWFDMFIPCAVLHVLLKR